MPIAAEVLKKLGVYDKRKVLGVTTLDVVSARPPPDTPPPTHPYPPTHPPLSGTEGNGGICRHGGAQPPLAGLEVSPPPSLHGTVS